jgi:chromosome segregation ATPase
LQAQTDDLQDQNKEISVLQVSLREKDEECSDMTATVVRLDRDTLELEEKVSTLEEVVLNLNRELEMKTQTLDENSVILEEFEVKIQTTATLHATQTTDIEELRKILVEKECLMAQHATELEFYETEISDLKEHLDNKNEQLDTQNEQLTTADQKFTDLQASAIKFEEERLALEDEAGRSRDGLETTAKDLEFTRATLVSLKQEMQEKDEYVVDLRSDLSKHREE